jgi:hypothetical protein
LDNSDGGVIRGLPIRQRGQHGTHAAKEKRYMRYDIEPKVNLYPPSKDYGKERKKMEKVMLIRNGQQVRVTRSKYALRHPDECD